MYGGRNKLCRNGANNAYETAVLQQTHSGYALEDIGALVDAHVATRQPRGLFENAPPFQSPEDIQLRRTTGCSPAAIVLR